MSNKPYGWRPDDWVNPHEKTQSMGYPPDRMVRLDEFAKSFTETRKNSYEAGAEAMLEALKKGGLVHFDGESKQEGLAYFEEGKPGWLVFIPDDKSLRDEEG